MPSKSPAQAKLMNAVSHNPAFAKKVGVPQAVGQEYADADEKGGPKKKMGRIAGGKNAIPAIC